MANTYTSLNYHIVFSTKNRERWIRSEIEQRIWAYLGGIARDNKSVALQIGGIDDHVHLLLGTRPSMALSKIVQLIKGGSSAWIHDTFPKMRGFGWQDGYGAFTVSKSNIDDLTAYIQSQRAHHSTQTFQQEYLSLLRKHGIHFDENHVFD